MIYVFTFLGEFGYELLNWHGLIRAWADKHKSPDDKIVICSRAGLNPFYEDFCDHYFDISNLDSFKNTVADCYTCFIMPDGIKMGDKEWAHHRLDGRSDRPSPHLTLIKKDIIYLIQEKLGSNHNFKFVFSCDINNLNNLLFGHTHGPWIYAPGGRQSAIPNNKFKKIKTTPSKEVLEKINSKINIKEPYVLIQSGFREHLSRCPTEINYEELLKKINIKHKTIFLNFSTNRLNDSFSKKTLDMESYNCSTFEEQSVLISNSEFCLFTTEGDIRSHTYLPPFLGKDVHVVAPKQLANIHSNAAHYWNEEIFQFGGKMHMHWYEDIVNSNEALSL